MPPPEYNWHVMLNDSSRFQVQAAYVTEGISGGSKEGDSSGMIVLKDKDHHPVFAAPPGGLLCVERGVLAPAGDRPALLLPLPDGVNMTPGQICDLQDSLNEAAEDLAMNRISKVVILPPGSQVARDFEECGKP